MLYFDILMLYFHMHRYFKSSNSFAVVGSWARSSIYIDSLRGDILQQHEISKQMVEMSWESIVEEVECQCDSMLEEVECQCDSMVVELECDSMVVALECDSMVVELECDSLLVVLECGSSAVWEDETYAHEHDTCTQCGGPP